MQRRWAVSLLAATLMLGANQALADTQTQVDPADGAGPADIRALTVDNTGEVVGARVRHRGISWTGRVRLSFDVAGGPRPEFHALVTHDSPTRATFTRADGTRWRCAGLAATSRAGSTVTRLDAPRRCVGGAATMQVRARVVVRGRVVDEAASDTIRQQSRPNVVMVMVDDMRVDDQKYMPWTRRLIARQGVNFVNAVSPYPLCCPARASTLSGLYVHNHRVFDTMPPFGFTSFDDSSTLATWLERGGYANALLGKYLNGYGWMPEPGTTSGNTLRYVPPGWTDWRASFDGGFPAGHPQTGNTYAYFNTTLSDNGRGFVSNRGRYQTEVYGNLSQQIVREHARSDKPFFYYLSFTAPHNGAPRERRDPDPVVRSDGKRVDFPTPAVPPAYHGMFNRRIKQAPGADWDPAKTTNKPEHLRLPALTGAERAAMLDLTRQRAEALHVVDLQVRRLVRSLRASGELEETFILFTSDNGYFLGEQGIRSGKTLPHDPALRVPLLVRGPGIPVGEKRYDPFMTIDLAPTIADFAGVRPGHPVDGTSMLPVARHGDRGWKRAVLTATGPRDTVQDVDDTGAPLDAQDPGRRELRWALGVRTDRYLYVRVAAGEGVDEELYDMALDPKQLHNLVRRDPVTGQNVVEPGYTLTLKLLRDELQRVRACDGAACREPMNRLLWTLPGDSIRARR